MSAPATNALSPTPVITINLTSGFDTDDLTAWSISENVSIFKAFNFFGLLIEMVLTLSLIRLVARYLWNLFDAWPQKGE